MKIRSDFVSNSSSSSFVIFGNRMEIGSETVVEVHGKSSIERHVERRLDVSALDELGPDEAFLIVLRDMGTEGDYIIKLTPELLMDFDLHPDIDISKAIVIKAKYFMSEGGYVYRAAQFNSDDAWMDEEFREEAKGCGIEVDGLRMFRYAKDYGNPSERSEILKALETYCKYTR